MSANVDGRPLYVAFQFLPSKRRYPEYYSVIDNPIDLKTIAQKIQAGEYGAVNDLEKDLLVMVRNACHFNEPGSQIYKDAKALKKVIIIYYLWCPLATKIKLVSGLIMSTFALIIFYISIYL